MKYLKTPSVPREQIEVTNGMVIANGVGSSSELTGSGNLVGTLLDPSFQGKDVFIDIGKLSDDGRGFPLYEGGPKVVRIVIPWQMRHGLRRLPGGSLQVPAMLSIANGLVQAIANKDRQPIMGLLRRFSAAYSEEMIRVLNEGVGRPRNPHSGMLVAAVDIREDSFTSKRFASRDFSSLQIGEIGVSSKVINKLTNKSIKSRKNAQNKIARQIREMTCKSDIEAAMAKIDSLEPIVKDGTQVIASRWPVTDVVPTKLRVMTEESKKDSFVIYVPAEPFMFLSKIHKTLPENVDLDDLSDLENTHDEIESTIIRFMKMVEGDNDGDGLNFNVPSTPEAKAEISDRYNEIYANAFAVKHTSSNLTWKDHVDEVVDERSMLLDKMEQKLWIGALSILMYAYYAYSEWKIGRGQTPAVTPKEWLDSMTVALELCFDKKHNNASDPRPLYGTLNKNEKYPWSRAAPLLEKQGLDVEVFGKVMTELNTSSLRNCALLNTPFSIMYMTRNLSSSERSALTFNFLKNVPESKTAACHFLDNLMPSLRA